jgi:hypothetical protein
MGKMEGRMDMYKIERDIDDLEQNIKEINAMSIIDRQFNSLCISELEELHSEVKDLINNAEFIIQHLKDLI